MYVGLPSVQPFPVWIKFKIQNTFPIDSLSPPGFTSYVHTGYVHDWFSLFYKKFDFKFCFELAYIEA